MSRPRFSGFLHLRTSPETKFRGRSSDAVQAYVREGAEHGKRRGLLSPGNLTERSLSDPSRCAGGVLKALKAQHLKTARPRWSKGDEASTNSFRHAYEKSRVSGWLDAALGAVQPRGCETSSTTQVISEVFGVPEGEGEALSSDASLRQPSRINPAKPRVTDEAARRNNTESESEPQHGRKRDRVNVRKHANQQVPNRATLTLERSWLTACGLPEPSFKDRRNGRRSQALSR